SHLIRRGGRFMDRLRRSSTDKVLFGVCGGLANYFQIDPVLIRVGFVALTLAGGSGLLIYLVLAIIMPGDTDVLGDPSTPGSVAAHDTASRRTQGLAAVLIIIGVVF